MTLVNWTAELMVIWFAHSPLYKGGHFNQGEKKKKIKALMVALLPRGMVQNSFKISAISEFH